MLQVEFHGAGRGPTGNDNPVAPRARGEGVSVAREAAERLGGAVAARRRATGLSVAIAWPLAAPPLPRLDDRTVLLVAGEAGPAGRVTEALEGAGAEVALCLDPRDAVASARDEPGAWDLAVVAGEVRGVSAQSVARRLRAADGALPVLQTGPAAANGPPAMPERGPADAIVRAAHAAMWARPGVPR